MAVTASERECLDSVSLDAPWALVETFAAVPRWRPQDGDARGGPERRPGPLAMTAA